MHINGGVSMFLKKDKRPNGRIYLSIVKGYRDPITKKNRQKSVMKVGFFDELIKEYDDPIAHFEEVARKMTEEERQKELPLSFKFSRDEEIDSSIQLRKNIGYLVLSHFYHLLEIDKFMINRQRNLKEEYSLNNIFQALVYLRILSPSSKKASFETLSNYFFDSNFSLADIYRALSKFNFYKDDLILSLHERIRMLYGRNLEKVYYDVTNYYFEIPNDDDFRKKGFSKEHRPNPIVQMGLLMDQSGLPITYKLFEGNVNDCNTMMPVLHDLKDEFGLGKVIVVADKGINTGENIAYNIIQGNGYIYSQTIRGATNELKDYVLNEEGYIHSENGFKIKSRIVSTKIWITDIHNRRKQVDVEQKQIVFYSPDYDKKAKHERNRVIEKARKLISRNQTAPKNGSYKYLKKEKIDRETGEILDPHDFHTIDKERILEEEKYDGYYLLVTSELGMKDGEVIDAYRGLWKIEESFKITKSELKARPVYLSRKDRIDAHFLICFISLTLLRLLEKELKTKGISTKDSVQTMREMTGTYLDENYYLFDCNNDIVKASEEITGIEFSKRFASLKEIKDMIAFTKKNS